MLGELYFTFCFYIISFNYGDGDPPFFGGAGGMSAYPQAAGCNPSFLLNIYLSLPQRWSSNQIENIWVYHASWHWIRDVRFTSPELHYETMIILQSERENVSDSLTQGSKVIGSLVTRNIQPWTIHFVKSVKGCPPKPLPGVREAGCVAVASRSFESRTTR